MFFLVNLNSWYLLGLCAVNNSHLCINISHFIHTLYHIIPSPLNPTYRPPHPSLHQQFCRTDRQTDRQTDMTTYRSSLPELTNICRQALAWSATPRCNFWDKFFLQFLGWTFPLDLALGVAKILKLINIILCSAFC